jgi:hypothetical protein
MHKVRGNYSSCTCRSSENICSSNGGAQEEGKTRFETEMKLSLARKVVHFSEYDPFLKATTTHDVPHHLSRPWASGKVLSLLWYHPPQLKEIQPGLYK